MSRLFGDFNNDFADMLSALECFIRLVEFCERIDPINNRSYSVPFHGLKHSFELHARTNNGPGYRKGSNQDDGASNLGSMAADFTMVFSPAISSTLSTTPFPPVRARIS